MNRKSLILTYFIALFVWFPVVFAAQIDTNECSVGTELPSTNSESDLYTFGGTRIGDLDLPDELQQALYDARLKYYKTQAAIIDQAILLGEIERKAKEAGKTPDEVAQEMFVANTPTEQKVKKFYENNKDRINSPLESIEDQIIEVLIQRDIEERQMKLLDELKKSEGFEILFPKPVAPHTELATDEYPFKGAEQPKVTIIEFADYQCPHCKKAAEALSDIVKRYPDQVQLVFVDFPINPSGISRAIAEGGACASQQKRFWAYHDRAFSMQDSLNFDSPTAIATELELDMALFESCLESDYPKQIVGKGEAEAARLGLNSTPTLFLNGRKLHLHNMDEELAGAVEFALSKGS